MTEPARSTIDDTSDAEGTIEPMVGMSVFIPIRTKSEIIAEAKRRGVSMSTVIRERLDPPRSRPIAAGGGRRPAN